MIFGALALWYLSNGELRAAESVCMLEVLVHIMLLVCWGAHQLADRTLVR